jgi:hypothetical protein
MARTHTIPDPEQDACISEFVTILRQTGADVLANDPKTQLVLTNRNQISGNTALIDNAEAVQTVAGQLATVSEGPLVPAIQHDAVLATDSKTPNEDANVSAYKFAGRLFRYRVVQLGGGVIGSAAIIEAVKINYSALTAIIATPQFQAAWAAVLRYIGLG